jgi:hypothetical protein
LYLKEYINDARSQERQKSIDKVDVFPDVMPHNVTDHHKILEEIASVLRTGIQVASGKAVQYTRTGGNSEPTRAV